jgi:hypothetical protein
VTLLSQELFRVLDALSERMRIFCDGLDVPAPKELLDAEDLIARIKEGTYK